MPSAWSALPSAQREPLSCSCCGNRQCPEPGAESRWPGWEQPEVFTAPRARGAGRALFREAASPKCTILGVGRKTFFNPSKCIVPRRPTILLSGSLPRKSENPHSPGVEPLRRLAPGCSELRTVPTPRPQSIPHWLPFFLTLSPPLVSSSSNTNCLHGKSPSMTRFSTHKRKLWATDPTS